MGYITFKVDGKEKFFQGIDDDKHELILSDNRSDALHKSSGYYLNAYVDFLKFHFKKHPLIKTLVKHE